MRRCAQRNQPLSVQFFSATLLVPEALNPSTLKPQALNLYSTLHFQVQAFLKFHSLVPRIFVAHALKLEVFDVSWLAVKELHLSYYIGQLILNTLYIHLRWTPTQN